MTEQSEMAHHLESGEFTRQEDTDTDSGNQEIFKKTEIINQN